MLIEDRFNQIERGVWISAQISPADLPALAGEGFAVLVNHRPDREADDQPTGAELEGAAARVGIRIIHIPVTGLPSPEAVAATSDALAGVPEGGKALLFCRSGMRSAAAWAMARRAAGGEPDDLKASAAAAGYDLSRLPL